MAIEPFIWTATLRQKEFSELATRTVRARSFGVALRPPHF